MGLILDIAELYIEKRRLLRYVLNEVIIMTNKTNGFKLNDGLELPAIGLGTYRLSGRAGAEVIRGAIDLGYRLIDSAYNYENEGAVGAALRGCSVPRSEVLVTSKLPGRHQKYGEALAAVEESLFRAGLDYYDLYLIHWPNPGTGLYVEAWQALIAAKERGMAPMGVAHAAFYLGPDHSVRRILFLSDDIRIYGLRKAGPSAAGFEFIS